MITVVIPCRHYTDMLSRLLARLPDGANACIVNNAAGERVTDICRHEMSMGRITVDVEELSSPLPLYESWRYGLRAARGDIVCLHSVNDPLDPYFIDCMSAPLLADPHLDYVCCREGIAPGHALNSHYDRINSLRSNISLCRNLRERAAVLAQSIQDNFVGNIYSVMWRKRCHPEGYWQRQDHPYGPPRMIYFDWDFLLRLFLHHRGVFLHRELFTLDLGPDSPWTKLAGDPVRCSFAIAGNSVMRELVKVDPDLAALRSLQ